VQVVLAPCDVVNGACVVAYLPAAQSSHVFDGSGKVDRRPGAQRVHVDPSGEE
jgi:hypothetical protein